MRGTLLDATLGLGGILPTDVRALIAKDLRVFWRDTTQWGQTAMLFGLLTIYTVNLRHFSRQLDSPYWISMVSYLNLGACALNLATITTRFIFPQFSLEGKRVWVVGLAPLGLVRVVMLKFWLGTATTLALTLTLILLSCSLLHLGLARTLFFAGAITLMSMTLNAVAVGMGSLFPNFRENNPNKIVNGFGGTFCLVVSFVYIVGSVALLAVGSPWGWHLSAGGESGTEAEFIAVRASFSWTVFFLVSVLVGWLPLRFGLRRVAREEL
jgi:ABC-2 type transport system permease protein